MAEFDPRIDYYRILGVSPDASPRDIARAWHQLAARYHPDKHLGHDLEDLAREKLIEINDANRVLSSDRLRTAYDEARRQSSRYPGVSGPPRPGTTPPPPLQRLLWVIMGIGGAFLLFRAGVLRNPRVALPLALVLAAIWFGPRIIARFRRK